MTADQLAHLAALLDDTIDWVAPDATTGAFVPHSATDVLVDAYLLVDRLAREAKAAEQAAQDGPL